MPTFIMSEGFSKLQCKAYMQAARTACRLLNADHYDATVAFRKVPLQGVQRAAIAQVGPSTFFLLFAEAIEPHEVVYAISHELVHFDQIMRGDMREGEEGYVIWKGQAIKAIRGDDDMIGYMNQPWEKEAFAKGDRICLAVAQAISFADRNALDAEHAAEAKAWVYEFMRKKLPLWANGPVGENAVDKFIDELIAAFTENKPVDLRGIDYSKTEARILAHMLGDMKCECGSKTLLL